MSRGLWFLAGAAGGVYALVRLRRVAEAFTPDGVRDRLAGLSLGARLLAEDIRAEAAARETELRRRPVPALAGPAAPAQLEGHPPAGSGAHTDRSGEDVG